MSDHASNCHQARDLPGFIDAVVEFRHRFGAVLQTEQVAHRMALVTADDA